MKKRLKNISLFFLSFIAVISFSACGNNTNTGSNSASNNSEEIEAVETAAVETQNAEIMEESIATPISGECGENLTYSLTKDGTLTISGTGSMTNYESDFNEDKMERVIYTPWFEQKDNIKKIIVEEGVTSLSDQAFYECRNLEDVELSESIEYIHRAAFERCKSLKSIIIPNGLSTISPGTFMYCTSLEQIVISPNVKTIDDVAFTGCYGLEEIIIPDGVQTIGNKVFLFCKALRKVTIPASVTEINSTAFDGCENVTICTTSGSFAETYAKDNGLKVEIISE